MGNRVELYCSNCGDYLGLIDSDDYDCYSDELCEDCKRIAYHGDEDYLGEYDY